MPRSGGEADRTAPAALGQLRAMGCEQFEVGLRDITTGRMLTRIWDAAQLERGLGWLRHMNRQHHDIFIRPAEPESTTLVLVDDLDAAALDRMKHDGIPPAVILETSPTNYQAWIRVSVEPIAREDATAVARELAHRYGGDPGSVGWRHYSRLAGFTNQKPSRRRPDGRQPFVLLREATGVHASEALPGLLAAAEAREASIPAITPSPAARGRHAATLVPPGENYRRHLQSLLPRYPNADYSRLDWMICRDIASSSPDVDEEYLERALREGSPRLSERKAGHVDEYVARTARKVLLDPSVVLARQHLLERAQAPELGA